MAKLERLLRTVLSGQADRNVRFRDLRRLLIVLGFTERIRGDHHIYTRDGIVEIINLQPLKDGKAKPYQVRQVRNLILQYRLGEELSE